LQEALRFPTLWEQRKRGACAPRRVVFDSMGRRIELQGDDRQ